MDPADYFAIQNLLNSYPYALDRGDFAAVGVLLGEAEVYSGGVLMASRNAVAVQEAFTGWVIVHADGTPRTRHFLANLIIDGDGSGGAVAKSYVAVMQQAEGQPLQPVICGDYRDTLRKVDGAWRIVERRMGNDLIGNLVHHGREPGIIRPSRAN
jgi:hypothetical protein